MILIAPDKFKGSLKADEAARIIAMALRSGGIVEKIKIVPMSDGGEGTPDILNGCQVVVSNHYVGNGALGFEKRDVMRLSSYALGVELMNRPRGCNMYVGIGGTATSDGGAGMLQAMGVRFYNFNGVEISIPITPEILPELGHVDLRGLDVRLWRQCVTGLVDVKASLFGPGLSALSFALQKGASSDDIITIDRGLRNLHRIFGTPAQTLWDGAGGGIGFALSAVIGVPCVSGAEAILASYDIDWDGIKLVISGEGRIDEQTAGGKVVDVIRREAEKRNIPFMAFGGYVTPGLRSDTYVSTIETPSDFTPGRLAAGRLRMAVMSSAPIIRKLLKG